MRGANHSVSDPVRLAMAASWGVACLCAAAAPFLVSHSFAASGSLLYLLFSRVCHQIPERSFELFGYPLALCHRCLGIYAGMFLGSFAKLPFLGRGMRTCRIWVLAALAPLAFDALAPVTGLWTNSPFSRLASGLLFGFAASSLVVWGLVELAHAGPRPSFKLQSLHPKGDLL